MLIVFAAQKVSSLWPLFAGLFTAAICVALHVQTILLLIRWMQKHKPSFQQTIPIVVTTLLLVHVIQIALFAGAFAGLQAFVGPAAGELIGDYEKSATDLFYFSSVVYTTVGFGDIRPEGDFRTLAAIEALSGMLLVAISASFTFVVLQQQLVSQVGKKDHAN